MAEVKTGYSDIGADLLRELIRGGSIVCTGGSQKRIDGSHSAKYSLFQSLRSFSIYNYK